MKFPPIFLSPPTRAKVSYKLNSDAVVLESKEKSGITDKWSVPDKPFKTTGGGTQYFTTDNTVFVPKNNSYE